MNEIENSLLYNTCLGTFVDIKNEGVRLSHIALTIILQIEKQIL